MRRYRGVLSCAISLGPESSLTDGVPVLEGSAISARHWTVCICVVKDRYFRKEGVAFDGLVLWSWRAEITRSRCGLDDRAAGRECFLCCDSLSFCRHAGNFHRVKMERGTAPLAAVTCNTDRVLVKDEKKSIKIRKKKTGAVR